MRGRTPMSFVGVGLATCLAPVPGWGEPGAAPVESARSTPPEPRDGLPVGSPGQPPIEISEIALESLLDMKVSAPTRQPVKIGDAPSNVSAVTREQIRDYGWRSLNDLLYTLPGFARSQDFERRLAGFRGERERWNSNHLLLLIDGMPHNNIETGGAFTWEDTPIFFARRLEVVRGPVSAVYGSNAMYGAIALETVSADDLGDGGIEARLRAGRDSQTIDAVGAVKGRWADAAVGLSATTTEGDDYLDHDDSYRVDGDGQPARFPVKDERSSSYLWLKVAPHGPARGLELSLHRQIGETETGHGWAFWIPDTEEYVRERRTTADLRYRRPLGPARIEAAAAYSRQHNEEEIRFYPSGALDGFYPQGVTEAVDLALESVFARGQAEVGVGAGATLLGGVEYSGVLYRGDHAHYANAQLVDPTGEFPQLDGFEPLGPMFEPIVDRPVHRVGVYGQAVSGALLGDRLELTVGARYDDLFYRYADLSDEDEPVLSDSHKQLSPRAGLVARPTPSLRLKLMAGRSYRTPTIVELFSSNSWTANSNPKVLRPETMTSYEAAVDWAVAAPLRLRGNVFYVDQRHVIDYVLIVGLVNAFSNKRAGGELELLTEHRLRGVALDGFASYSYVRLLDESVIDPDLSPADRLVWSPSHLVKAGLRATAPRWGATATAYYQGKTRRRSSDRADELWRELRPFNVSDWVTLSATAFLRPHRGIKVGVEGENLLGAYGRVLNTGLHAYDYRTAPREVMAVVEIDL